LPYSFLMDATARDFFQTTTADTKGLDDLFEVRELDANQDTNQDAGRELDAYQGATMSVEEAAERLEISIRAVQKRLQKGSLAGLKRQTPNGKRWFVIASELDANRDAQDANQDVQDANQHVQDANQHVQDANQHVQDANQHVQDANQHVQCQLIEPTDLTELAPNLTPLVELLEKKDRELEAASYRIGYLEAQLETERQQVKLLTDSQHKLSWWTKFISWFMGSQ